MTNLIELAERVEKATEGSRELDALIECAIARWPEGWSRDSFIENAAVEFHPVGEDGRVGLRAGEGLDHVRWNAAAYTTSIDDAMTLVPEGFEYVVGYELGGAFAHVHAVDEFAFAIDAATPALALVAASLRAKGAL